MNRGKIKNIIKKGLRDLGFRDYLTTPEEIELIKINCLYSSLEGVVKDFKAKGNLTSYESRNLKTAMTCLDKALISITGRQDLDNMIRLQHKATNTNLYVVDKIQHELLKKETTNTINAAESVREYYYDLCSETMAINCQGCKKAHRKCGLYKEFTKNMVAEPSGEHYSGKRCKYGYTI